MDKSYLRKNNIYHSVHKKNVCVCVFFFYTIDFIIFEALFSISNSTLRNKIQLNHNLITIK